VQRLLPVLSQLIEKSPDDHNELAWRALHSAKLFRRGVESNHFAMESLCKFAALESTILALPFWTAINTILNQRPQTWQTIDIAVTRLDASAKERGRFATAWPQIQPCGKLSFRHVTKKCLIPLSAAR